MPPPPDKDENEEPLAQERDLADDAEWKKIQRNTFTRWVNKQLKDVGKSIKDLQYDLSDGLNLIALTESLSKKKIGRYNKKASFRSQKLENVTIAMDFLIKKEKVTIVNIDSTDIVDSKIKLILGLIWALIPHYAIVLIRWPEEDEGDKDLTPKARLLKWIQSKIPEIPIQNMNKDWNDGRAVGALVDALAPGLCPNWRQWTPTTPVDNCKKALDAAEEWLDVPQLVTPEEMANPHIDDCSMVTYLSQFPGAKIKDGAPTKPKEWSKAKAFGPGLEKEGNKMDKPTQFTVETAGCPAGNLDCVIVDPNGTTLKCDIKKNNDAKKTYTVKYTPKWHGKHLITLRHADLDVVGSPFSVNVSAPPADPSKLSARGPGIEPSGNKANLPTSFDILAEPGSGPGKVEVQITDPNGKSDAVKPMVTNVAPNQWRCDYIPKQNGKHVIGVTFNGTPIPNSPWETVIGDMAGPTATASGRGLQRNGVRVGETALFKVFTKNGKGAKPDIVLMGPGGKKEKIDIKPVGPDVFECSYVPKTVGAYTVIIKYGGKEIPGSPYQINVKAVGTCRARAFGPGLVGGVVNQPARFTVELNGEEGKLAFDIQGPGQAKVDCKDNGDGSCEVTYLPPIEGEYVIHITLDDEDIPMSPFIANISPATKKIAYDKVKVSGPGVEKKGVKAGAETNFTVDATKAGPGGELGVFVMDADYNIVPLKIDDKKNGTWNCKYTPKSASKHTVVCSYGGVASPGSPFRVFVDGPPDASKVKVYGPGADPDVPIRQSIPTSFTVDCAAAGSGVPEVKVVDAKGGAVPVKIDSKAAPLFNVSYTPKLAGEHTVNVKFDGKDAPKTPAKVTCAGVLDATKVKVEGLETAVPLNSNQEFYLSHKEGEKLNPKDFAVTMSATLSGKKIPFSIDQSEPDAPGGANGLTVKYVPTEMGEQKIDVQVNKKSVPKTPARVKVSTKADPGKVKCTGDGLVACQVGKPAGFRIDTRKAGQGDLKMGLNGPSQIQLVPVNNQNGIVDFQYTATIAGQYELNIEYDKKHVPGSPFKIDGTGGKAMPIDAGKVKLNPSGNVNAVLNKPFVLNIDPREAGPGDIGVDISGPSPDLPVNKQPQEDGTVNLEFTPSILGAYDINITFSGKPVPGSPVNVNVTEKKKKKKKISGTIEMEDLPQNAPPKPMGRWSAETRIADAKKVKVEEKKLTRLEAGKVIKFKVDPREAGVGSLQVNVIGPLGEVPVNYTQNDDGTVTVEATPEDPGNYELNILYNGWHVPNSPFHKIVGAKGKPGVLPKTAPKPKIDPNLLKFDSQVLESVEVRKKVYFLIDAKEAGPSELATTLQGPKGQLPISIVPDEESGNPILQFEADQPGPHQLDISYGGQHLNGFPLNFNIGEEGSPGKALPQYDTVDPGKVIVEGLDYEIWQKSKVYPIKIDTRNTLPADLNATLTGPGEARLQMVGNEDGTVRLDIVADTPGEYELVITYDGQQVPGSPYTIVVGNNEKKKKRTPKSVSGELTDVVCEGDALKEGVINETNKFIIFTPTGPEGDIGGGASGTTRSQNLHMSICGPSQAFFSLDDNDDGSYDARYVITEPGNYELVIMFNSKHVPGSPFSIKVPEEEMKDGVYEGGSTI